MLPRLAEIQDPVDLATSDLSGEVFWTWPMSAAHELDLDTAVLLGDFGLGSDAPIVLDCREPDRRPVLRLQWVDTGPRSPEEHGASNHWIGLAAGFDEFVRVLGL